MRTVFIHEFVAGGGFAGAPLPDGLLSEGLAMLEALLSDLGETGGRRILTTIDDRLSPPLPRGVEVIPVAAGSHEPAFRKLAAAASHAWIIAPETGGRLARLTELAERLGATPVGSSAAAVRLTSDKLALSRRLAGAGLPVPRTWPSAETAIALSELGFPLVAKPVAGAGCEGVGLARDAAELEAALARARAGGRSAVVQEYIEGEAASASILCATGRAQPLSLNAQDVRVGPSFAYGGGGVPLHHPLADRALAVACRACETIPGLAGYVGVDLVLSPGGPFVIEINPRLTTAYIGLRAATDQNVAEMILEAVERGRLPEAPRLERAVRFTSSGTVERCEG